MHHGAVLELRRKAEREGERIGLAPRHLDERQPPPARRRRLDRLRLSCQRIDPSEKKLVAHLAGRGGGWLGRIRMNAFDAHHLPVRGIRVGRRAGGGAEHFLEQEIVAGLERRAHGEGARRVDRVDVRRRRAARQAALLVAPGVEAQLVVERIDVDRGRGLEDAYLCQSRIGAIVLAGDGIEQRPRRRDRLRHRRHFGLAVEAHRRSNARYELVARLDRPRAAHVQMQESPGVAAVVHRVVHELRVQLRRLPLARRVEEGLVGDGVLEVAEVVAFVREQLEQRNTGVGGAALGPCRVPLRDEVEQHLAEARVVLGEVVQHRLAEDVGRTILGRRAVEVDRAAGPEIDRGDGEQAVDGVEVVAPDAGVVTRPADREQVGREVALLIHFDVEHLQICARCRFRDGDSGDARAAVHA